MDQEEQHTHSKLSSSCSLHDKRDRGFPATDTWMSRSGESEYKQSIK